MTSLRHVLPTAAVLLLAAACSGTGAAAPTTPSPASTSLPLVLTASGYVVYPQTGPDCTAGNLAAKGDAITLTDPSGTVVDTSKLIDAFPVKADHPTCQSSFALNTLRPVDGDYTLTLGSHTKKVKASEMTKSITWQLS